MVFAGMVLARAAALHERRGDRGLFVNQTQSYGPAASGDIINCDVVVSEDSAFYPFVEMPDYLIAMSQPAYDKFADKTDVGTVVILEEDLVDSRPDRVHYDIPALRRAEEMGRAGSANMIMLGAFNAISRLLSEEAILQSISKESPSSTEEINRKAFSEGMNIGRAILESQGTGGSG